MRLFIKNVCVKTWAFLALALSFAVIYVLSLPLSRPLVSMSAEKIEKARVEENAREPQRENERKNAVLRREYALYSASSSARFTNGDTLAELPFIRGETIIFQTDEKDEREAFARRIVSFYEAEIKFSESVGGGVSYYCYSDKIGSAQRKIIGDTAVNLHVFISESEVRAGVPLIFGGY